MSGCSLALLETHARRRFEEDYEAISALIHQPDPPSKAIGFTAPIKKLQLV